MPISPPLPSPPPPRLFFSKNMDNLVPSKQPIWQTDGVRNNFSAAIYQISPMPHFGCTQLRHLRNSVPGNGEYH